jgi:hypothetical protein
MSPRRLVPIFVDADRIGDVEEVLYCLGIETSSTADGHHENLDHSVPRPPEPELQDDASLYGCSIDQYTHDGEIHTNQSSELENVTSILSRISVSTNSPPSHVDSYPAKSAPALFSGSSPPVSPVKKKYYVVTVGKCTGIYYDEWRVHFISAFV